MAYFVVFIVINDALNDCKLEPYDAMSLCVNITYSGPVTLHHLYQ